MSRTFPASDYTEPMQTRNLGVFCISALVLIAAGVGTALLVRGIDAEPVHRLETPALLAAPAVAPTTTGAPDGGAPLGAREAEEATRIGLFQRPESVPEYEVLEKRPDERDGARAVRLLVDTRSRSEEDFTLIARDLKARYADYDAVPVQFTDTADVLGYNGSALIFNTYDGVTYMGYIYGPPNMDGYYVTAAE